MKNSILIDTENQVFKVNGEDVGDSEASKNFKFNNEDLKE